MASPVERGFLGQLEALSEGRFLEHNFLNVAMEPPVTPTLLCNQQEKKTRAKVELGGPNVKRPRMTKEGDSVDATAPAMQAIDSWMLISVACSAECA
eukprot:1943657-Amphidinium_carterae.1